MKCSNSSSSTTKKQSPRNTMTHKETAKDLVVLLRPKSCEDSDNPIKETAKGERKESNKGNKNRRRNIKAPGY